MKPVFKCDYCSKMGTEEEIREHEPKCFDNYDRRSCFTCKYKRTVIKDKQWCYECAVDGIDIAPGRFFEFCEAYEREEKKSDPFAPFAEFLPNIFG